MRRPGAVVALLGAAALLATGCTASPSAAPTTGSTKAAVAASKAPRAASSGAATSAAASATATAPAIGIPKGASPLSGRPGGAGKPVLVVKLDNTPNAQPHSGLKDADIVYLEEVEYGITRIAAVFSSTLPAQVGPVRSARITDLELLAQYGSPAFAYSGAQTRLRPVIAASPLLDVSGDLGGAGYHRVSSRPAPYNFFGNPERLLARAPKASKAKDIGFVFSAEPPAGGSKGTTLRAKWPAASAGFVWDPKTKSYAVSLNGRPARATEGGQQHAKTVVVQYVQQEDSGYHDHWGGRTPLAHTVGKGTGLVLRDGKVWKVTWLRQSEFYGTRFTLADGSPMPFAVGQEWVLLVNKKSPVTVG